MHVRVYHAWSLKKNSQLVLKGLSHQNVTNRNQLKLHVEIAGWAMGLIYQKQKWLRRLQQLRNGWKLWVSEESSEEDYLSVITVAS